MAYGSRSFGTSPDGVGQAYGGGAAFNLAPSTDAQITPTTTLALIRDAVVSAVEALTPSRLASKSYRYSRAEADDFRAWADANDSASLREFAIEFGAWEPFGVSDGLIQRRRGAMTLTMAYPHHWAIYQTEGAGRRSMEDVIERDLSLIAYTAGIHGTANYPSAACPVLEQAVRVDRGEGVSFGVLDVEIEWYARLGA